MPSERLSQLAETLIGSEIVKLGNDIKEKIKQGNKIYNFTIGDFDPSIFPIPAELEALIIESYQQKHTSYPAAEGVLDLRKSVSSFIKEWEGCPETCSCANNVKIIFGAIDKLNS